MKLETNTLPSVAALGRAVEMGAACRQATTSNNNYTTTTAQRQTGEISQLLLCGVENAIPRRDLMTLTGHHDRELRRLIEAERRSGVPILSDNANGYFLPGEQAERDRFVRSMRRRAAEILETAQAIEEAEI